MSAANAAPSPGRSLRALGLVLAAQPVVVLVAILFVLPPTGGTSSLAVAALVAVLAVAGLVAAQAIGGRTAPLPAGLDEPEPHRGSLAAHQQGMILRFVITGAAIIVSLALSFVVDLGPWPFALGVVLGVPSMLFHVLVRQPTIERVRTGLGAGGTRSYLGEALAL